MVFLIPAAVMAFAAAAAPAATATALTAGQLAAGAAIVGSTALAGAALHNAGRRKGYAEGKADSASESRARHTHPDEMETEL